MAKINITKRNISKDGNTLKMDSKEYTAVISAKQNCQGCTFFKVNIEGHNSCVTPGSSYCMAIEREDNNHIIWVAKDDAVITKPIQTKPKYQQTQQEIDIIKQLLG